MNSSLAYSDKYQSCPVKPVITGDGLNAASYFFNEADIAQLQSILNHFSHDSFMDAEWSVKIATSGREAMLRFPVETPETEGVVLRILVLDYLRSYAAASSCKRAIHDARAFFLFLKERRIHIRNCRSSVIDAYVTYLDSKPKLSVGQKNSLMRTVGALMDVCAAYGVLKATWVINCSHRWKERKVPRRAPDRCVITELDTLFFDMTNTTIPLEYRCIYFLLRLIPNRISEVLLMDIDCLTYPDVDVYAVSIPTSKETPYHTPSYCKYNRKMSGWCEGLMLEALCAQRAIARQKQSELEDCDREYLFVSPNQNKIIDNTEFNAFLKQVLVSNQILDSAGNQAHVTSHDFRHVAIGERLRGNNIPPTMAMVESNHSSLEQTMGYGYQSPRDEAAHLGAITSKVFQEIWGISSDKKDSGEPIVFPEHKYRSVTNQPFTRLIPGYGICCEVSCSPRHERCFRCKYFQPNDMYLEYFEDVITVLKKRIDTLQKKSGGEEAIQFNKKQLACFQSFVERITDNNESETA